MRGLKKLKEIQRLIGRITSLTRFLPRKDEKAKPIMNLLKRKKRFRWDQECEEDFQDLNLTPAKPPLLSKLDTQRKLITYLSISREVVSATTIQEQEEGNILSTLLVEYRMMLKCDIN